MLPQRGWRALLTWKFALGSFLTGALLAAGAFLCGLFLVDVPEPNKAALAESNIWRYSDGSVMARTGEVYRQSVALSEIPKNVQHAVLAAEQRTFYEDPAFSPSGMARALWSNLSGGKRQGGSTITQQYVKNYYLNQDVTLTRKFKEFFIAVKVDKEMSKDDILEAYLNTSYYGRGAYGIQAAAKAYYGTDARGLTTEQGAYLATVLNAPGVYDVGQERSNREKAVARWNYVLDGMVRSGWLPSQERADTQFPEPREPVRTKGVGGQAGYLVDAARSYLKKQGKITTADLDAGGWDVTTTFDKNRQDELVKAIDDQLGSVLSPDTRKVDRNVRVGAASIDPESGNVVALYGGPDYLKQFMNDATRRDIQVGSTFKPFVLASALANGSQDQKGKTVTVRSIYNGDNKVVTTRSGYAPGNQGGRSYGPISVRDAMIRSVNTVFSQLGEDVGLEKVRETAIAAGLPENTPELTAVPSLPLGVSTPSAVDMAGGYATFASRGVQRDPRLILEMKHGSEKKDVPAAQTRQAFSQEVADTVTSTLRSVVDDPKGTGRKAQAVGRPAAGKTGTTNDDKSVWFVGYTPDLVTSVGVFREDPDSHARLSLKGLGGSSSIGGGTFPALIWSQYTKAALQGTEVRDFPLSRAAKSAATERDPEKTKNDEKDKNKGTGGPQEPEGDPTVPADPDPAPGPGDGHGDGQHPHDPGGPGDPTPDPGGPGDPTPDPGDPAPDPGEHDRPGGGHGGWDPRRPQQASAPAV
ncbi:transglycosylase domain-containing protein [Streptomyces vinaceus]|uniref:transglycosylase domain-containing protein n=1 Tax=Streptomyces vinaceus TaxID=1960 RepID=UPI0038031A9B